MATKYSMFSDAIFKSRIEEINFLKSLYNGNLYLPQILDQIKSRIIKLEKAL
jgi:hypothetical protein